ncbi:MAG: motility associated factor glycosyltransferase family protein [bacterium]
MDHFKRNAELLFDIDKGAIIALGLSHPGSGVEIVPSRLGHPTARVRTPDGRSVLLHSAYDPIGESRKLIDRYDLRDTNYLVFLGFGLGYHALEAARRVDRKCTIFIVERDLDVFRAAMRALDLSPILSRKNTILALGPDEEVVFKKWGLNFQLMSARNIVIIEHPAEIRIWGDYYVRAAEAIKNTTNAAFVDAITMMQSAKDWQENTMENILHILRNPGIDVFYDRFEGVPAFVVSSGPSLDKNAQVLKDVEGRAIIISVGSAIKPLLARGIRPDITVAVDANDFNIKHLVDVDYEGVEKICLVAEAMVHPEVFTKYRGPRFVASRPSYLAEWIQNKIGGRGFVYTGGTVSVTALDIAVRLGCNPICLVGQDLSYPGGKTHAQGSTWDEMWLDQINKFFTMEMAHYEFIYEQYEDREMNVLEMKDIYGNPVVTHRNLVSYLHNIERYVDNYSRGRLILNATEGGLPIRGVPNVTLREVVNKYVDMKGKKFNFAEMARRAIEDHSVVGIEELCDSLRRLVGDLQDIVSKCDGGVKKCERLYKLLFGEDGSVKRKLTVGESEELSRILGELNGIDDTIKRNEEVAHLLFEVLQPVHYMVEGHIKRRYANDNAGILMKIHTSEILYRGYSEVCGEAAQVYERALRKVEEEFGFERKQGISQPSPA